MEHLLGLEGQQICGSWKILVKPHAFDTHVTILPKKVRVAVQAYVKDVITKFVELEVQLYHEYIITHAKRNLTHLT